MVRAQRLMKLQPYLDMVKHSRLLAPNLKETVLHTYSKKHPSNDVARFVAVCCLLAAVPVAHSASTLCAEK